MTPELWIAFVAATIVLLLIPGPTVLLVLSYALAQGRRVAIACAAGVALGDLLAMSASLVGLGAILMTSATVFTILKWIGAAYLVWLGIALLRAPPVLPDATTVPQPGDIPAQRVFAHAFAVTALNPKSIVFFVAFVPQFIDPARAVLPQTTLLIATFVGLAGLNALAYALLADRLRQRIRRPSVLRWINRAGGTALIGMGIATAALRR